MLVKWIMGLDSPYSVQMREKNDQKNSVLEHFLHSVASWNTNFLFLVASSSSLTLKYFCVFSGKNILAYPTEIFILLVLDG